MTIEIIEGCIFDAFERGDITHLVHQVNCQGVMGGFAGEVKRRYPEACKKYKATCNLYQGEGVSSRMLGIVQKVYLPGSMFVVNLFGQDQIGTHKRQTNYGAVAKGLLYIDNDLLLEGDVVGFPYGFGCGLGGADWEVIYEMIDFIFRERTVKIYKLPGVK